MFELFLLFKPADIVNKRMDEPSKWLRPFHRIVRHDISYGLKMASEIPKELNRGKLGGKSVTPTDVMKAYGFHLLMDSSQKLFTHYLDCTVSL